MMRHVTRISGYASIVTGIVLAIALLLANQYVHAISTDNTWMRVDMPADGEPGNWQLAFGSDIVRLDSSDGGLYAAVRGVTYSLYRSTDGGYHWTHPGNIADSIIDIKALGRDFIYYATKTDVYRSADGGRTFMRLPRPGGAGSNHVEITDIDVASLQKNVVAVATRDTDPGDFGGVFLYDESDGVPAWTNTGLVGYDVYALAFSPSYLSDRELVAVASNEVDTDVVFRAFNLAWGAVTGSARLNRDNSSPPAPVPLASASVAFPSDYHADPPPASTSLYVAVNSGSSQGDLYRIDGAPARSFAADLNVGWGFGLRNVDLGAVAVSGKASSARIVVGAAATNKTYSSSDRGANWLVSKTAPTGSGIIGLVPAPNNCIYAASTGPESAISVTRDWGSCWQQTGLIDTSPYQIVDFAPGPADSRGQALFMLGFGAKYSLWRTSNDGGSWDRLLSSTLPGFDTIKRVALPPTYSATNPVVFMAGSAGGSPTIWKSSDGGQNWVNSASLDPTTSAPAPVSLLKPVNNDTILVASYDGANGLVYTSVNGGFFYSTQVIVGSARITALAVSPDFTADGAILAGNTDGWVFLSTDNGTTFQPVPHDAATPPLSGSTCVFFDPGFASNRTIYATSDTPDKGVLRFVLGASPRWERINTTLASGSVLNGLAVSGQGILYASNFKTGLGMERSLDPTSLRGPVFQSVSSGLADSTTLQGVWITGDRVWSVDTSNARLVALRDRLVTAVTPTSPADKAAGLGTLTNHTVTNVRLEWAPIDGVLTYEWQIDTDGSFSSVPPGFQGSTQNSQVRLPALDPNTTYFWRVRTATPVLGSWSTPRSWSTTLDMEASPLRLESPKPGDSAVPVRPLFQWAPVIQADAYELVVSREAALTNPVIARQGDSALVTTSWDCNVSLDYSAKYFWKVRGVTATTRTAWSGTGTFTTVPAAAPAPTPAPVQPAPLNPPPSSAAARPSQPPTDGYDRTRDVTTQPLTYPDKTVTPSSPPVVVIMPSPELPTWMTWFILGQVAITLGLIVALVVVVMLALRKRSS